MSTKLLRWLFCLTVLAFALYHFAENTVDPDLWGHVLFGQRMIAHRAVEHVEPLSWTARGQPWINHEVLAEIALATAYRLGGGSGLLVLKMLVGLLTFVIALRLGAHGLAWPARATAWAIGLVAVVEIAFGFAARPQIFTALALAILLWILHELDTGRRRWLAAIPLLFAVWINTHGGALAGFLVLVVAAGAATVECLAFRRPARTAILLWSSSVLALAAMAVNPWGFALIGWLGRSVLWMRPEIQEWNATAFDWDHLPTFLLLAIAVWSFVFSRQPRRPWAIAVLGLLAAMALRHVRHAPLFAIGVLVLTPRHAADSLSRIAATTPELARLAADRVVQRIAAFGLTVASALVVIATFTLHKEHPLTMEVPAAEYPVAAVDFIRQHHIHGNAIIFFDWGEMALWKLPDCPPSVDGRLDTCYPRAVLTANWDLYNGKAPDPAALDVGRADFALLPRTLAGVGLLRKSAGWSLAYEDALAAVLVRDASRFPGLRGLTLPVMGGKSCAVGRFPFP